MHPNSASTPFKRLSIEPNVDEQKFEENKTEFYMCARFWSMSRRNIVSAKMRFPKFSIKKCFLLTIGFTIVIIFGFSLRYVKQNQLVIDYYYQNRHKKAAHIFFSGCRAETYSIWLRCLSFLLTKPNRSYVDRRRKTKYWFNGM